MNFSDSSIISKVFGSESLKIYLRVLLFLVFLELIIGRIFLHVPQLSGILLPFTLTVMNFEAIIELPILISLVYIFWRGRNSYSATVLLALSSVLLFVTTILSFSSLAGMRASEILWLCFLFVALATIFAASTKRILAEIRGKKPSNFVLLLFLVLVNLTYLCVYIYFSSFNLSIYFGIEMPEPIMFFTLAQDLILADALVLFLYSLLVPSKNLSFSRRLLSKVFLLPSLVVALLVIALVLMPTGSRFDVAEIIALMLSMWGFAVAKTRVLLYIIIFWFFLVATLLLREKGQDTKRSIHTQEFIGAFLIFFAGFLNTSPYLLMAVIAIILFSSKIT